MIDRIVTVIALSCVWLLDAYAVKQQETNAILYISYTSEIGI